MFAKVLFQSKSNKEVDTDVDLPQPSNRGEYNFHDLEVGSSMHAFLSCICSRVVISFCGRFQDYSQ